jgi:uncharacterized protein YggE
MVRRLVSALFASCMAGSAALAQTASSSSSVREPEIVASGRGEVRLAPTYAVLAIGITTRENAAVAAASENARKVQAVTNALRSVGLSEKEIATSGYRIDQNFVYPRDGQPPVPSGFSANTTIRAEVRRLDNLGKVVDAATAAGATGVSAIQFLAVNTEDARRSAMAEAVRQARTDAEVIARAAGGSLGRLIALNSAGVSQPTPREVYGGNVLASEAASMAPAPPPTRIMPGELNVTAQVFGRWEFVPGPSR